jgi:hypothetical protein
VALFWLKVASSGRGALARTRWVHFNYNDKNTPRSTPRRSVKLEHLLLLLLGGAISLVPL